MAHLPSIIRIKIKNFRQVWRLVDEKLQYSRNERDAPDFIYVDAWEARSQFFAIQTNEDLVQFLNSVGKFLPLVDESDISHYWRWQRVAKAMLRFGPKRWKERFPNEKMVLPIEASSFPAPIMNFATFAREGDHVVTEMVINGTFAGIAASIYIDRLRGIRFGTCARKDCEQPFPIESKRRKIYCKWYCGHLVSMRKTRRKKRLALSKKGRS
jgi:hypothetical protein